MAGIRSIKVLILILISVISFNAHAQTPAQTIPEFTIFKQDKSTFTNKDLNSNKLLFFLFFDVKCEHCRHAIQTISGRYSEMDNTFIHLITLDKPEEVNAFLEKFGKNLLGKPNVMLLFDLRNEFIIKFKPRKYPSIFLYTPQHKLLLYDDNPENLPKFFDQIKKRSK